MIKDRRYVAGQLRRLQRELDDLAGWMAEPDGPFPADDVALGEFVGEVAVLLLAGGTAPGDGPPSGSGRGRST